MEPFGLLEAMQNEKAVVDQLIDQLNNCINTIITEIYRSHEEVGVKIADVP